MSREKILVLDFGSQYAHLIAKRFRMLGYYSEIALPSADISVFENAKGIVFSGGPSSVYDEKVPEFNSKILELDIPILGLCYGHYIVQLGYGGKVKKADVGEFGFATLELNENVKCPLFDGIEKEQQVWMSHQDAVYECGEGFEIVGSTKDCKFAAMQNLSKKRFSLQFHCEVKDTPCGNKLFENFALFCKMEKNWDQDTVLEIILDNIKKDAKDKNVLLFLSGGVDSTVAFALLNKALGQERVLGLHIDNGFMRKNESQNVADLYHKFGFTNFIVEDASESFLNAVKGLTDPQKKRMAVGENFISVRNEVVAKQHLDEDKWLLAQGTLYPDIIESGGTKNSNTIKTHHNRVDGIQKLLEKGLVIEPIKELYKDEVRSIGKKIGLNDELVMRHPFPGPGLSINVLCSDGVLSDGDKAELNNAQKELEKIELTQFCEKCTAKMTRSVLPVKSVGVQGDFRTYRFPAVLTFAEEENGFYHIPHKWEKIESASSTITNSSSLINRTILRLWKRPGLSDGDFKLLEGYCDKKRLDQLREVDNIVLTELHKSNWYNRIFQHLTIDIPYASKADHACFVLRPVVSEDVMTARFAHLDLELLKVIIEKISKLDFVDALYYDVTNKPPATFGWE
ncbi:glutamine-hydrolyzing GMP synthase [Treponema sp.]|uniref:glutamine-hydrolyzing GMP synthase n=1 Tax=Treponema sp. TaxID=166 RepID=UPI00298E2368|nr:glutamine-hydrolyzing GMP synthase [Treponema sp.]